MRNDSPSVKIKLDASSPAASEMRTAALELLKGPFPPQFFRDDLQGFTVGVAHLVLDRSPQQPFVGALSLALAWH